MSDTQRFKVPIPKGYRIFFRGVQLAGASYRKKELIEAVSVAEVRMSFEPEPENAHDKNAIKVIAEIDGWIRTKHLHLGYIPRDIAALIHDSELDMDLLPRPTELWVGDKGGVSFVFDILGRKDEYVKLKP